ncbi:MAG: AMP-dependent synthetase/ligase, partial [Gemmatimonadales bacterium]
VRVRDRAELVSEPRVLAHIEEDVRRGLDGVARHELPKKLLLLDRELTLEGGEVTPTLKVKRRVVEERLRDRIEALYAEPAPRESG